MNVKIFLDGIKAKFLILLLVFQIVSTLKGNPCMTSLGLLIARDFNPQAINSNNGLVSDPFIGKFIGQIIGQQLIIEIRKAANGNYEIYVNGLGPDIAVLKNDVLSGTSDGFAFSISLSGRNVILTMFEQPSLFVRDETGVNNSTVTPTTDFPGNANSGNQVVENEQDFLVGTYSGYGENNIGIKVVITKGAEQEYLLTFNGVGPTRAEKSNGMLLVYESGVPFSFEADAEGLYFKGNGKSIRLKRDKQSHKVSKKNQNTIPVKFEGTYNAYGDGKDIGMGKVTIKAIGDNFYNLTFQNGTIKVRKSGEQLFGTMDGKEMKLVSVRIQDNVLLLCISGVDIELTNGIPVYSDQSSRQIDQRIIGKWRGSKTYNSGYGGGSSINEKLYLFREDGTYEHKSSSSFSGSGWSSSSDGDVVKGGYLLLWLTEDKSFMNIGGRQVMYEMFNYNRSMKLDGMIYEKL